MKKPIFGKEKILMFRLLSKAEEEAAARLALQIEHNWSYERNTDTKPTKDGAIVTPGSLEVTLELNAISTRDALNLMLKESVVKGEKLEVWDIDLGSKDAEGKYDAEYAVGNLNSWEVPANVEDTVDISTTMSIDGRPAEGKVTLTDTEVSEILVSFRGLEKYVPEADPGD